MKNKIIMIFALMLILPLSIMLTACGGNSSTNDSALKDTTFALTFTQTTFDYDEDLQTEVEIEFTSKLVLKLNANHTGSLEFIYNIENTETDENTTIEGTWELQANNNLVVTGVIEGQALAITATVDNNKITVEKSLFAETTGTPIEMLDEFFPNGVVFTKVTA